MSSQRVDTWSWPDPALGPPRPGLRPHRHPPNRLPVWCLEQEGPEHTLFWCDIYGNEHLVSTLAPDYASAIEGYLRARAPLLFGLRLADLYLEAIELSLLGLEGSDVLLGRAERIRELGPMRSLEATPLMSAIARRLDCRDGDDPKRGGSS